MKIVTVLGSPRLKGNTNHVLSIFEKAVSTDHVVERINVVSQNIKYCQGCFTCKKTTTEPGCPIEDDVPVLFDKLMAADAIVYATPLYGKSCTAQLKTFLDRHYALVNFLNWEKGETTSLLAGKHAAFLATCGGPLDDINTGVIKKESHVFHWVMKTHDIGLYMVPHCIKPDMIGEKGEKAAMVLSTKVEGIKGE